MAQELHQINVLEITPALGLAGGPRTLLSFCKYFNYAFFKASVAAYGEGGTREKDLRAIGITPLIANGDLQKIVSFAREQSAHVIHFHRSGKYNPTEFELIKQLREALPSAAIIETNVFGQFDKASDKYIDSHLLKSKMMLNERFVKAAGTFDFERMKVVYNPVDHDLFKKFTLSADEISAYKKQLGIRPHDFVIGRLGRADLAKWSDLVLEMLPYALKEVPNLKFIIQAAPASRIEKVKKQPWADHVIFLDETTSEAEVHRFYQTIDVLAHSSKIGEAFGNTLNEAMYWKKPVVVDSTPKKDNGQIEQIEHLQTGIIANYPETYGRAIGYLAKHPDQAAWLGENGHKKVTTEYDPKQTTERLEKVFVEKLGKKGHILAPQVVDFYAKIRYYPSAEDIAEYAKNYQELARRDFGERSISEQFRQLLRFPRHFYRKVRDFIEHRFS
jgi:glycosyltransferase involved in cell wall biosynthesis